MKRLLCLVLLIASAAHAQQAPEWFAETFLDVREDVAEAGKDGKRLMLYFWLEGCPYCKRLEDVTFRDPAVAQRMKRDFVSVAVNVRGDREITWIDGRKTSEKELARFLRLRGTPTLLFFGEDARVLDRAEGYLEPVRYLELLDRVSPRAAAPRSASPPGPRAPR